MKKVTVFAAAFAILGTVALDANAQTTQQKQQTQKQKQTQTTQKTQDDGRVKITQAELPPTILNTLKADAFKAWTIDEIYKVPATAQASATGAAAATTGTTSGATTGTTTTGTTTGATTMGTTTGATTVGSTAGTTTSGTTTGTTSGTTTTGTTSGTTVGATTTAATATTTGTQPAIAGYTYEITFKNAEGKGAIARFNEDGTMIRAKDQQ
ncbi:hypothetical protein [Pontibacter vulgaris]|uniref:hypothetical protein n=1 Tax=Pontibacter vulgaris TaxID=2905679 RepID=UPI001FA7AE6D|nr:hypothetical protein [Pontibacter vulgaris]